MNCRECQDRLLEQFGGKNLPVDLAGHIESCAECGKVWADLHSLEGELGGNAVFYPEPDEAERVAELVDREIRVGSGVTVIPSMPWLKYATVAAAVLLVSVTATMWKWSDQSAQVAVNTDSSAMGADTTIASAEEELPGNAVSTLLEDFTGRASFSAGEELLGDLTDEEAAYLETELKAGDLL